MHTLRSTFTFTIFSLFFITTTVSAERKPENVRVQTNRYTWTSIEPAEDQKDLLTVIVDVTFPDDIKTVGHAMTTLLQVSGYRLGDDAPQHDSQYYLYSLPLPEAHRHLGPMQLVTALELLGGPAYELQIEAVKRRVSFQLGKAWVDHLTLEDIRIAKEQWIKNVDTECAETRSVTTGSITRYGPVKKGETLSAIVASLGIQNISSKQLMMAFFDHNPDAFEHNNINLLKTGVQLTLPADNTLQVDLPFEAATRFRTHLTQWKHFTNHEESTDKTDHDKHSSNIQ